MWRSTASRRHDPRLAPRLQRVQRLYLYYGNRPEVWRAPSRVTTADHVRVASPYIGSQEDGDDLQQYVFGVTDPIAHHQADTWGAPDELFEEIDFADSPAARFIGALERTLGEPQPEDTVADSNELRNFVSYNEQHVLTQLAGNFTVCPRDTRFVYAGNNPRMLALAARCLAELGFTEPLHYVAICCRRVRPGNGQIDKLREFAGRLFA